MGGPGLAFETWVFRQFRFYRNTQVSKARPGPPTRTLTGSSVSFLQVRQPLLLQWGMPPSRTVQTVCSHDCPDSCAVLVTIDESGKATRVQGDPEHPVTRGFLCAKVSKYLDRVYSPSRVLYPLRRRPGAAKGKRAYGRETEAFEPIGWDEALNEIAERL